MNLREAEDVILTAPVKVCTDGFSELLILTNLSIVAVVAKFKVDLKYPNIAVDQFGNIGTWTMVYNQVRMRGTDPSN